MKTKETKELTERFNEAMHEIVKRGKVNKSKIDSLEAFAESIGQSPQNMYKFKNGQHVGTNILSRTFKRYRVNPTWLFLGEGEMFLTDDLAGKVNELEKRLKRLEARI